MEIDLLLSRELNTIDSYINKSSDVKESYILEKYKSDLKSLIIEYRNKMYYNGLKSINLITYDLVSDPGFNSAMNVLNYAEYVAEYVAENLDSPKSYSEYIAENLDKNIAYSEYIAENLDNSKSYSEYVAENLDSPKSYSEYKRGRKRRRRG